MMTVTVMPWNFLLFGFILIVGTIGVVDGSFGGYWDWECKIRRENPMPHSSQE
jgi:hypothetical protein